LNNLITIIKNIDLLFCQYLQTVSPEKPSLIVFNFHKIFKNKADIYKSGVDPQQGTTLSDFRLFIEYFLSAGYNFIHPNDIPGKLNNTLKYILITFDDGYYNNTLVLPIIKEYKTPTIFFIASNHVLNNEAFWWDIIYRLKDYGVSSRRIAFYKKLMKNMNPIQVKEYIKSKLSNEIFIPRNEYDRPFNENELKDFSIKPYVIIGNHTADHAVLTNCSNDEVKYQIEKAQNDLGNITDRLPKFISYPNGGYSNEIIEILKRLNLKLGFTTYRKKNYLPFKDNSQLFIIKRFMLSRLCHIETDGLIFRSNYSFYNSCINLYSKLNNLW
jgi:peptidoglycan/xylan/chitin deacetylase (PgdA/CDA1 family)